MPKQEQCNAQNEDQAQRAKRFKIRSGGSIKRSQAFKRHILTKKTTKNKRHLRGTAEVHATDKQHVRAMLPYA